MVFRDEATCDIITRPLEEVGGLQTEQGFKFLSGAVKVNCVMFRLQMPNKLQYNTGEIFNEPQVGGQTCTSLPYFPPFLSNY